MARTTPVLLIIVLLAGTRASFLGGLRLQVSRALHRLSTSGKQTFYLLDGVHVDKLNGTSNVLSHNDTNAPLAQQTDRLFDDHDLLLDLAPEIQLRVHKAPQGNYALSLRQREGRTFGIGARKRLQMALLPIMYKLGVITTLLVGLTVLTLKAITIGVVLLILAFGGIFTKFKSSPWEHEHHGGYHKDVHIHVHPFSKPAHWYKTGWQRQEAQDYEALDSKVVNTKVPAPTSHQAYSSPYHYHQPQYGAQYGSQHYNTATSQPYTYPSSFGQIID